VLDLPHPTTRLVGRGVELAELSEAVGFGRDGGGAVLLAGDAGVGKTRLLTELQDGAQAAGWRVLVGHCLDVGDDYLPYLPFGEMFARLSTEAAAAFRTVSDAAPALTLLLPAVRSPSAAASAVGADGARAAVVDAVGSALVALVALAGSAPVLVVVEDLHWADPSTREVIGRLFSRAPIPGLSVVATYRSDDLHRRHPLRPHLAAWSRLRGLARLHLQPLPAAEVVALIRQLHPQPMRADTVEGIVERAEGNAFFVEELVAAARHGGPVLPGDLSNVLLLHLDELDEPARTVVRAAAVAGRQVGHDLLAQVVGGDGPRLDDALRTAVERQVLVGAGSHGYAFRHALLAEAVYDDLLPGERVRWHRAYAAALAEGSGHGTAAALARHARAAHDIATAISASIQAGEEALAVGGPAEATSHYEQALELLSNHADAAPGIDLVDLVLRASQSAMIAGLLHRSFALAQQQLVAMPSDAPAAQRAALLQAMAAVALVLDDVADALSLTTQAVQLVPLSTAAAPDVAVLRAQVLAMHARACLARGRTDESRRWAEQAAQLARELDLPAVLADASTTLAGLLRHEATPEAAAALRDSIAEARAAGDAAAELRSSHWLGTVFYESGRLAEAQRAYESVAARAVELRRPWAPYGVDGRAMAALVSYARGEWDAAQRILDTTGQSPPHLAQATLTAVGLAVAAGRGDVAALTTIDTLGPARQDGLIALLSATAAIDLLGDSDRVDDALAAHDEIVDLLTSMWAGGEFQGRIRLAGLALGHLATAAAAAPARVRAGMAERGRRLHDGAVRTARGAAHAGLESQAWLARAAAEHQRLRWLTGAALDQDALVLSWSDSVVAFERFGHVFEVARSRARLAGVLRAVGRAEESREQAGLALATAERLGARPLLRELRGLATARSGPAGQEQLTPREQEVLVLVAAGRSNREIGQVLYISPKTVSVHVSNVLAKLGAAGRTEAAAVARQRGLL